jgi:hypothetical protein
MQRRKGRQANSTHPPCLSAIVYAELLIPEGPRGRRNQEEDMDALLIKIPEVAARLGVSRAKV